MRHEVQHVTGMWKHALYWNHGDDPPVLWRRTELRLHILRQDGEGVAHAVEISNLTFLLLLSTKCCSFNQGFPAFSVQSIWTATVFGRLHQLRHELHREQHSVLGNMLLILICSRLVLSPAVWKTKIFLQIFHFSLFTSPLCAICLRLIGVFQCLLHCRESWICSYLVHSESPRSAAAAAAAALSVVCFYLYHKCI